MNTILNQSMLKNALLEKKRTDTKDEAWQDLNEKALTAIQFCLTDEKLDEFFQRK